MILMMMTMMIFRFDITCASPSALYDRWKLPDVPSSFQYSNEGFAPDGSRKPGINFNFGIPISRDVATHEFVEINLYDQGCKYNDGQTTIEITKGTTTNVGFPESSDETDGPPMVMSSLDITLGNGEDGMTVASLLEEYPSLWDEGKQQISFCFRFSLQTEGIEVNFFESLVFMKVKMEGVGFEINEFSVGPKEKTTEFQRISYNVKAYMCDGFYRPFEEEETGIIETIYEICNDETGEMEIVTEIVNTTESTTHDPVYQQDFSEYQLTERPRIIYPQGSIVRVCIRPDDTAMGKISMRTIQQLYFEGTVEAPNVAARLSAFAPTTYFDRDRGIYTQIAVEEGTTEASSGLSILSCENNRLEGEPDVVVCAVDTLMVAAFYWRKPGNAATVNVYGTAILKFGADEVAVDIDRRVTEKFEVFSDPDGTDDLELDSFDPSGTAETEASSDSDRIKRTLGRRSSMVRGASLDREENEGFADTFIHDDNIESEQAAAPDRIHQHRMTRDEYVLGKFWNMTQPKIKYSEVGGILEAMDFTLNYTVSDAIDKHMAVLEVWNKECQQDGMDPALVYSSGVESKSMDLLGLTSTEPYETGNGTGTQNVVVTGRWKRDEPDFLDTLQNSEYYFETSDGSLVQIAICVRYQLHLKGEHGGNEVNFRESNLAINIDFKAGIPFNQQLTFISDEDSCLDDLQRMSGGYMRDVNDLFYSGLYWRSGQNPEGLPHHPMSSSKTNSAMIPVPSTKPWDQFFQEKNELNAPKYINSYPSSADPSSANALGYSRITMMVPSTFIIFGILWI